MRTLPKLGARAALAVGVLVAAAPVAAARDALVVMTQDVERFYRVFDRANGRPSADDLQREYLDAGSDGLKQFMRSRRLTAQSIVEAIGRAPEVYADARTCASLLPAIDGRLAAAAERLADLYPDAQFPPVTFLIGRNSTGGTTDVAGVLVGLETLCWVPWMQADREDRFVHLVAHEYAHVQQPLAAATDDPATSNLMVALIEGGAEFVAELTSGSASYRALQNWARGRERMIETEFVDAQWGTDRKAWFYNGAGTADRPGDLGYWVGYRIAKAYYLHAADKRQAVREILQVRNAQDFITKSGWTPGMALDSR